MAARGTAWPDQARLGAAARGMASHGVARHRGHQAGALSALEMSTVARRWTGARQGASRMTAPIPRRPRRCREEPAELPWPSSADPLERGRSSRSCSAGDLRGDRDPAAGDLPGPRPAKVREHRRNGRRRSPASFGPFRPHSLVFAHVRGQLAISGCPVQLGFPMRFLGSLRSFCGRKSGSVPPWARRSALRLDCGPSAVPRTRSRSMPYVMCGTFSSW